MNDFLQNLRNTHSDDQRIQTKSRKNFDHSHQHSANSRFHSQGSFTRSSQPGKRTTVQNAPANAAPKNKISNTQSGLVESALLADAMENLSSHLEILVKTQEYTAAIQEKVSTALDNQTRVFEKMLSIFQEYMDDAASAGKRSSGEQNGGDNSMDSAEDTFDGNEEAGSQDQSRTQCFSQKSRTLLRKRSQAGGLVSKISARTVTDSSRFSDSLNAVQTDSSNFASMGKGPHELKSRKEIMDIIYSMRDEGATFDQVAKYLSDLGQPTFSGRGEWHAQTVHRLCNR